MIRSKREANVKLAEDICRVLADPELKERVLEALGLHDKPVRIGGVVQVTELIPQKRRWVLEHIEIFPSAKFAKGGRGKGQWLFNLNEVEDDYARYQLRRCF